MNSGALAQFAVRLVPAVCIVLADQASKWLVVSSALAEKPQTLAPFLRLVYAENTGAAFSFLAHRGEWAIWLLSGFSAIVCVILTTWLWRAPPRWESAALSLILGGALGNLIDRMRLGYVVDFIDAHAGRYHWPAFNVADSAITLGAIILLWLLVFSGKTKNS